MAQRLVSHHRAEVGAADADVDDVADRLAGVPGPLARAHPLAEVAHPVERLVHLLDHVDAVDDQRALARHPQRHVQHGAVLGDVDVLAGEHRFAALLDATLAGQLAEQDHRLVGDPVLREVEVEAGAVGDQPLAARRVGVEEVAQLGVLEVAEMALQRLPGLPGAKVGLGVIAQATTPRFDSIDSIRSSQDLTKAPLPSSCSRSARASTSIPALVELRQHLLGVAAVGRHRLADLAVVGEGVQGRLGHRVDRERRGEALDVEGVGGVGVLGPGARPEQPLRPRALVHQPLRARRVEQLAVAGVGAVADRQPEPVAQLAGHLVGDGDVPAAHEDRGDRGDVGIEPGLDPPFDPLHVGVGGGEVVLAREQQGDVDRDPGEDRLLDRRQPGRGAGDLDEEVLALRLAVQLRRLRDRRRGVVGELRRDLERAEAVDAGGALVDRREEVGGVAQVGDRQREEDVLDRARAEFGDLLVVGVAAGDRLVEDRRVRGQPGDRELLDVAGEDAFGQHRAGDVVEPEALAQFVQLLRGFHARTSLAASATLSGVNPNLVCTSFSGAELPKVCMPILLPAGPT